jgi:hypothetical protein
MLGRLEKVNLIEVWNHEARDFTNWLAKEENITLLSDTIGIDIEVMETEASVGSFNVDILAKDINSDSKIIIENQLERTDHDHLGKIITYASGYDAETIIWMVKDVRDEHRKAVEWLNNHLDERINIFLVQIEVWKIGDSAYAPKFNIVESPNNWAKILKSTSNTGSIELSITKKLQLEFWTKLKEYGEDGYKDLRLMKPLARNAYDISGGTSLYSIPLIMSTKENKLGVEVYIRKERELYNKFLENKESIEEKLGFKMEWQELPDRKASRVGIYKTFVLDEETLWAENFEWLLEKARKVKEVFGVYR